MVHDILRYRSEKYAECLVYGISDFSRFVAAKLKLRDYEIRFKTSRELRSTHDADKASLTNFLFFRREL